MVNKTPDKVYENVICDSRYISTRHINVISIWYNNIHWFEYAMKVKLTGEFAHLTKRNEIELYGPSTVKGLLNTLDNSYPNIGWGNSNIAINGTMYTNAWLQPITDDDEIVIMPPIEGG